MPRDFYSGVERDKVGELGMGYALFYQLTGAQISAGRDGLRQGVGQTRPFRQR
jgi:hypothetical protein